MPGIHGRCIRLFFQPHCERPPPPPHEHCAAVLLPGFLSAALRPIEWLFCVFISIILCIYVKTIVSPHSRRFLHSKEFKKSRIVPAKNAWDTRDLFQRRPIVLGFFMIFPSIVRGEITSWSKYQVLEDSCHDGKKDLFYSDIQNWYASTLRCTESSSTSLQTWAEFVWGREYLIILGMCSECVFSWKWYAERDQVDLAGSALPP